MITIKRLSECTLEEALQAWNDGFEGYSVPVTMTMESFIARLVDEGLSPRLSVVAFDNDRPVGIVKNGIRTINGKKVAWNGGTGVAKDYRKQGIGQQLMEATFAIYEEEGVEIATLEAIHDNTRAISLYEKLGYEVVDELQFLEMNGKIGVLQIDQEKYTASKIHPVQLESHSFFRGMNPWQTHWRSVKDIQVLVALDKENKEVGYAYFRNSFNLEGQHVATVLYQCEADPLREDSEGIINYLISQVFDPGYTVRKVIPNLPVEGSKQTYISLTKLGFKPIAKQVYMRKEIN